MKTSARIWSRSLLVCLLTGSAVLVLLFAYRLPRSLPGPGAAAATHPLDPLTAEEIAQAARTLKRTRPLAEGVYFPVLVLKEPPKEQVLAYQPGQKFTREAFVVVYDRSANETHEAIVDLTADRVTSYRLVPGVQPRELIEEYEAVPDLIRADPQVQAALAKRGFTDPKKVYIEVWATSALPAPGQQPGGRLGRALFYDRREGINAYLRPVGGLMALLDLNKRQVVRLLDSGVVPVSDNPDNFFDPRQVGQLRPAPRPLQMALPQGPTFTVRGHEVRWQNWSFRFANHQREGLVLYQVSYDDHGRVRPILYRGSLAELVVPYGDPEEFWKWRAPFDEGEYFLGMMAMPLQRGRQVPDHAVLVDSVLASDRGESYMTQGNVAVYERDGGVLWQHTDAESMRLECRRARELVVTSLLALGNYDYGLNWIFGEDGQLRVEVELGGIPLARAVETTTCQRCNGKEVEAGKAEDGHGTVVAPHIVTPNHQHWFCFRLDLDVDGTANTVSELNVKPAPPGGEAAFTLEERVLGTESEAQRDLDAASQRRWKIYNAGARTKLGHHPGYVLEPGENTVPHQAADSTVRRRAAFLNHHLWVTRYKAEEQFPAGDYPNSSVAGKGLPHYAADNEKLAGEDVVLWYSCGATHVPRPEDWPVMPSVRIGFRLVPHGFFTRNPALDLADK
jgi:primary-amine oxidase